MMFKNSTILITGGTGSFGHAFTREILTHDPAKVIIYSRDEFKQYNMAREFTDPRVRFMVGDVRDAHRLQQAMRGVDYVVHAAALKHVPICEYNPFEAVKTNVLGAMNVVEVAIRCGVKKVVALSTDKAVHPVNLYGATKLCSDKLMIAGNNLSPANPRTVIAVVRYGNVANSRGSVIPYFEALKLAGSTALPVTHPMMSRFYITLDHAVRMVLMAFAEARGGEVYVPKIPSFRIIELVDAMDCDADIIGIRPGEKLYEEMITPEDLECYDSGEYYIVYPQYHDWCIEYDHVRSKRVREGFSYRSDVNEFMTVAQIQEELCH